MASVDEAPGLVATARQARRLHKKLPPGPGRLRAEVERNQRARIHGAMIDLVAERGYDAVTARVLAGRAGVSTRTFYERFKGGKEECFLSTYDVLIRNAVRRVADAQAVQYRLEDRLRSVVSVMTREALGEPRAARLALVEAYAAGAAASHRAQQAEGLLAAVLGEGFACRSEQIEMPQPLLTGIVTGLVCELRSTIAAGEERDPLRMTDGLLDWMLSYHCEAAFELSELDRQASRGAVSSRDWVAHIAAGDDERSSGDRDAILTAVAKLAATEGYGGLTVPGIRTVAGIPRRRFSAHFDGVEDCFAAAFESKAAGLLASVARIRAESVSPVEGVYLAIAALCDLVARDPTLAAICFEEAFEAGAAVSACHERFVTGISMQLLPSVGSEGEDRALALRASASAIWGVLRQHAANAQGRSARGLVATLTYIALAPTIGAQSVCVEIKNIVAQNLIGVA